MEKNWEKETAAAAEFAVTPDGIMEIKVVDGKINRFVMQVTKEFPIFLNIEYNGKVYRTRPSSF